MPVRKGLLAPQNTFLDTIATRFDGTHSNFVLGNAQVPTIYPIVYCSDGFCELTGFARAQIMQKGCACKFLYGPETKEEERAMIDKSLESKTELKMEVVFYKKTGVTFDCLLDIVPIKNEKGDVVLFLASHKDITHTKNLQICELQNIDANGGPDPEAPPANYGRRRSRAVLYQLSGHYKQDNKHKIKLNNNLLHSTAAPLPEYKTTGIKKSQFVLSHYGGFKSCWDWLILIATFYVAIVVPFNASFINIDRPTMVSDVVVEGLFMIDIVLNFRTTYVNRKGEVVSNSKSIAANYVKGWFIVDLIAALPFDFLYASDVYSGEDSGHSNIHLVKLTRLLRLARLLQKMDRYSQYSAVILTMLMLLFILLAHWMACVWFVIAEKERLKNDSDWDLGWIHTLAERLKISVQNVTHAESYITALYFTCSSLTSVGFGNVSANTFSEKLFSICAMLIGDPGRTETANARLFPDHVVPEPRYRYTRGKGDLVGCDINVHLQHGSNGGGTGGSGSADVVVKSSCDVKALTYCDLKCIHMHGLVEVLRLYPEYQHEFAHDIQHDLTYNIREGYEAEQESDMNGPSLTLPSISEDDENVPDEGETSPLSPPNKSPLHTSSSPRHAKFREEYREGRRPGRSVLARGRAAQMIAQESMEEHIRGSVERLDTQVSTLHQDVATLSSEVRNAIQALQNLTYSPQSNPNLPMPATRGSGVLARSSSHPPDAICWNPSVTWMSDGTTQTEWPVDLFESWVRGNPHRVLRILELDPDVLLRQPPSPTPSPSSPPPPPYEPLSPVAGTPPHSPTPSQGGCPVVVPGNENYVFGNGNGHGARHIPPRSYRRTNSTWDPENKSHRFSAGDAENVSYYQALNNVRGLPESRSLKFDPFDK
ncbi:eag-like K[+] channel isoform X4 [Halictus rubicundus]|uniref:eag-like K[+] channel isoform X4 n=1 Tax=Halictus rubicundus TaxID=77578 RepID=UPI0040372EBF